MRGFVRIFLLCVVTVLMTVTCRKTLEEEDPAQLIIWLDIDGPNYTKAEEGNVPGETNEDAINDLRIWVFLHDVADSFTGPNGENVALLGYIKPRGKADNPTATDPLTQYENRYHIPVSKNIAETKPTVDIYVIGNPGSVGQSGLSGSTSRATLDGLVMQGTRFGVDANNKPSCTSVPSSGLPYTGVAKGRSMVGTYPVMSVEMVTVRKAVSKFRFVLCQLRDDAGSMIKNLQITGLSLNGVDGNGAFAEAGENISNQEYLFNDSSNPYKVNGYWTTGIVFDTPASIRRYAAPEEYVFNPPTDPDQREEYARQYEALINDGVNNKKVLTEAGKCYLRESDKQLSGKVSYRYELGSNTVEASTTFTMHAPGDFVRGRSWIVYIFFLRDSMHFSVSWTDWGDGEVWDLTPIDPMRPS